jgi:hypothetical protein
LNPGKMETNAITFICSGQISGRCLCFEVVEKRDKIAQNG